MADPVIRPLPSWPGYGLRPASRRRPAPSVHSRRLTSGQLSCDWRPLAIGRAGRVRLRRGGRTLSVSVAELAKDLEVQGG